MIPHLGLKDRLSDPAWRRRYLTAYCIALILAFSITTLRTAHADFPLGGPGDFTSFYTAGKIICLGQTRDLYDLDVQAEVQQKALKAHQLAAKEGVLPYANPPVFSLPFAILCNMPLPEASATWNILNIALLLLSLWLLWRSASWPSRAPFGLLFLLALSFLPVFAVFLEVQASFWLLLLFAIVYLALKTQRDGLAGVALAFAWLKPQLVFLLLTVLIVKRRWRALTAFGLMTSALLLLSVILVERSGLETYLALLDRAAGWDGMPGMYPAMMPNLRGTAFRLGQLIGQDVPTAMFQEATLVIAALLAIWTLLQWRGPWKPGAPLFNLRFAVTICMALLISPHVYLHDYALLVLVGFVVWDYAEGRRRRRWAGLWIGIGHAGVFLAALVLGTGVTIQLTAVYVFVLAAALVREGQLQRTDLSNSLEPESSVIQPSTRP